MNNRMTILDTTLRDGAQGEGVFFSASGKMRLAQKLDQFGIHYIEGGYAGSNKKDMEFFESVRKAGLKQARVVAFGATRRAGMNVRKDPMTASLLATGASAISVVGKSWDLHVRDVLKTTLTENLAMISDTIRYLKDKGKEVLFDAEHSFDGIAENPDYFFKVLETAQAAGADAIVLCDTNGGTLPAKTFDVVAQSVSAFKVPIGIHTHNDMGLAIANTIEAVRAGATHVQGTLNGFGERCGNADLCAIIPILELKMGLKCVGSKKLKEITALSRFANDLTNFRSNKKAPFVGESAFSHKAGTHVNAVKKNPRTSEHIVPETVGNKRRILMSELSGASNVLMKAVEMGLGREESEQSMREVLAALKDLESKGYAFEAADASFRLLMQKILKKHRAFFDLEGFRVIVDKRGKNQPCISEATVKVRVKDDVEQTVAEGDGPVNALDTALRKALSRFYPEIAEVTLLDYRVRILDPEEATAAKTQVVIESGDRETTWGTVGVSSNIIEASWEALVDSVEYKLFKAEEKKALKNKKTAPRRRT